ncbi:MAG: hypothetical protein IH875_10480, partial [Candidatus Dadabacteria bacterium]|nr:hypothetical protein [Candidatus Dadabacteria bacterium]
VLSFEACVFSDECFDVIPNSSTCPQDVVDAAQPGCAGLFGMDAIENILDILGGKTGPPVPEDDFCAQITE